MLTFRDFLTTLRKLEIPTSTPMIAHASLSAFGEVQGGAETVLGALLARFETLVMPTFTFAPLVIPEAGPPGNAAAYGSGNDSNRMAEFFHPGLPADRLMGILPEALRHHPRAQRSTHPLLSFSGINAGPYLIAQTLADPLGPLRALWEKGSWVLLLGVDHRVNTSIHFAERCAGRKGFTRWALTPSGIVECPGFPGCSEGFEALRPRLAGVTRRAQAGPGQIQAIPLIDLVDIARLWIKTDPLALLCQREGCERCNAVRAQFA
jgi:aminoglycoside 3-N-acetyltransferase